MSDVSSDEVNVKDSRYHGGDGPLTFQGVNKECGVRFTKKHVLMRHYRNKHLNSPPNFECPICHKKMLKRNYNVHNRRKHSFRDEGGEL